MSIEEPDAFSNNSLSFFSETKSMILQLLQLPGLEDRNASRWNYTVDNVIINMYNSTASRNIIDTTVNNGSGNFSAWQLAHAIHNITVTSELNYSTANAYSLAVNASVPLTQMNTQLQYLLAHQSSTERISGKQPACMMLSQNGFEVFHQDIQLSAAVQLNSEIFVMASNTTVMTGAAQMAQLTSNPTSHLYFVEQPADVGELSAVLTTVVQSGTLYSTKLA